MPIHPLAIPEMVITIKAREHLGLPYIFLKMKIRECYLEEIISHQDPRSLPVMLKEFTEKSHLYFKKKGIDISPV